LSDRLRRRGGLAVLAAVGLVVAALLVGKIPGYADFADMVLLPVAVALLVHAVAHLPRPPAIGPLPSALAQGARRLADISFSLYLVHVPLLTLVQAGLNRAGLLPLQFDPRGLGLYAVLFALTLLYAAVFAALTERRTDDIRAWLSRRRVAAS
jgi:peptidoglycan/LPS O-acetylase OafA/YrhL